MTTELPSINSTTSISDNADLRNYYENLLFKNSSGKSLADLPRRQELSQQQQLHQDQQQSSARPRNQQQYPRQMQPNPHQKSNGSERNSGSTVDFINGFHSNDGSPFDRFQQAHAMTPSTSEPIINSPNVGPTPQQQLYQQVAGPQQSTSNVTDPTGAAAVAAAQQQQQQQQPRHSMFYSPQDPLGSIGGFTLDFDRNNGRNSSAGTDARAPYTGYTKQSVSPGTMVSSLNADPFFDLPPIFQQQREPLEERRQQYLGARRSSYISDTLIHGNLAFMGSSAAPAPPPTASTATAMAAPPITSVFPSSLDPLDAGYPLGPFGAPPVNSGSLGTAPGSLGGGPWADVQGTASQARPLTAAPSNMYGGFIQPQMVHQLPPRRNTQPVNSLATPPVSAPFKASAAPLGARNRYMNFSKSNQPQQQQPQQHLQHSQQNRRHSHQQARQVSPHQQEMGMPPTTNAAVAAAAMKSNVSGQVPLDNGLVLVDGQRIASSPDLQALYSDCGPKYFSSKPVYEFADYIKSMLIPTAGNIQDPKKQSISCFLAFLKSCNLNYNPQSDAFVSGEKQPQAGVSTRTSGGGGGGNNSSGSIFTGSQERRSSTASTYLHYKPLVLVSLKNGKLELLSTPQNTNILMQRNDLVIIDGDRGKDLALVVEPVVDLDLALFVNFLKKKIHFDSLITSRSQHHPNNKFIHSLVQSTRGQNEELNSKLYDVIELTQLIVPSKQVLRFATPWEATTNLHNKFQDELKALHIAQLKLKSLNSGFSHHHHGHGHPHSHPSDHSANNNHADDNGGSPYRTGLNGQSVGRPQLNIKILNAEFQFDRKKLTFYYFCEERNDFRELIKELFKFYKTRIWLCAIPNNLGIDQKYYDSQRKELKMYQEMMQHYAVEDLADANAQQGAGFIVAPALNKIELDNFQIGVYRELVNELFGN